jgi:DNA polymerase-3 subunit epsilon
MWTRFAKTHPEARPEKVKLLFFDTETTGLPKDWKLSARESPFNYPDIVSLAWILMDEDRTMIQSQYSLVKPTEWIIPEDATAIHGITQEQAEKEGRPLAEVMVDFWKAVSYADIVIAHNMKFDRNVVINATRWRLDQEPPSMKTIFCTMQTTVQLCKLPAPSGRGFKFPKLSELYAHLYGKQPDALLHNSLEDTRILVACFFQHWIVRDLLASLEEKDRVRNAESTNQTSDYFTKGNGNLRVVRKPTSQHDAQGSLEI